MDRLPPHAHPPRPRCGSARTLLLALAVGSLAACGGHTPPFRDSQGNPLPGSIAALEAVEIGGVEQWVLIRGRDRTGPVLLWLHGGPGAPEMPVAPRFVPGLEDHFVVVHWDQRGAGKSNPVDFDPAQLSFERFVADAREMTAWLQQRFGQERIYLLGHSWGSQLGLVLAHRHPEDYQAWIGVGQHVAARRSQPVARAWLEERIRAAGRTGDLEKLRALGEPPYRDHEAFVSFIRLVDAYGGNLDVGMGRLVRVALASPHYTLWDLPAWLRGANRGSGPMWDDPDYQGFDAHEAVPRLEIPAYFLNGAMDYNTPLAVTRAWVEALEAPAGKELIVFDGSAHTPFLAEPRAFEQVLARIREETWPTMESSP